MRPLSTNRIEVEEANCFSRRELNTRWKRSVSMKRHYGRIGARKSCQSPLMLLSVYYKLVRRKWAVVWSAVVVGGDMVTAVAVVVVRKGIYSHAKTTQVRTNQRRNDPFLCTSAAAVDCEADRTFTVLLLLPLQFGTTVGPTALQVE